MHAAVGPRAICHLPFLCFITSKAKLEENPGELPTRCPEPAVCAVIGRFSRHGLARGYRYCRCLFSMRLGSSVVEGVRHGELARPGSTSARPSRHDGTWLGIHQCQSARLRISRALSTNFTQNTGLPRTEGPSRQAGRCYTANTSRHPRMRCGGASECVDRVT